MNQNVIDWFNNLFLINVAALEQKRKRGGGWAGLLRSLALPPELLKRLIQERAVKAAKKI